MTEKEFFIETLVDEIPRFDRVFQALPLEKISHTHHPKSKTVDQLVEQMTSESESFVEFLSSGKTDWSKKFEKPEKFEKMYNHFSESLSNAVKQAQNMTESDWQSEAVAFFGEKEVWKTSKGKMAWGLLLDLIHHRGQLSTYIRPMGGKVPSIYGPSGDTQES